MITVAAHDQVGARAGVWGGWLAWLVAEPCPNPYVGTFGLFLGAAISTLTGRMLTVGLPDLRGALGLGVDEAAWMPTAYNMALMFMGPFSVYLGGLLGPRRVLLLTAPIFALCSILLPFSPNLPVLLTLLVVGGLASGTFYPLALSYALRALPPHLVILAIGVYSIDLLGSTNLAIPIEAALTEHLSWHWIFWFTVPLTLLMLLCIHVAVPHPPASSGPKPVVNWEGFLYASLGLCLLYGALDQGERLDWLGSGVIVGMLAGAGFLLLSMLVRRWIMSNPLVDTTFIRRRNSLLLGGCLFAFRFVLLAAAVVIPGYLGTVQGYRPLETGQVVLWVVVPQVVLGLLSAQVATRIGGRAVMATGFVVVAAACLMDAGLTSEWAGDTFHWPQLVLAVGLSLGFVGLLTANVQEIVSFSTDRPMAVLTFSAFFQTVRLIGGEMGSVSIQRLITVREQFHSTILGPHVAAGNWVVDGRLKQLADFFSASAAGTEEAQGRAILTLSSQVRQQAFTLAYQDGFLAVAFVALLTILLIACMKRTKLPQIAPPS